MARDNQSEEIYLDLMKVAEDARDMDERNAEEKLRAQQFVQTLVVGQLVSIVGRYPYCFSYGTVLEVTSTGVEVAIEGGVAFFDEYGKDRHIDEKCGPWYIKEAQDMKKDKPYKLLQDKEGIYFACNNCSHRERMGSNDRDEKMSPLTRAEQAMLKHLSEVHTTEV